MIFNIPLIFYGSLPVWNKWPSCYSYIPTDTMESRNKLSHIPPQLLNPFISFVLLSILVKQLHANLMVYHPYHVTVISHKYGSSKQTWSIITPMLLQDSATIV